MLNVELVYTLYEGLAPERKEELRDLLFKKSRQTMAYFKRSKDISLSKLEILADFYQMPLDRFRINSKYKTDQSKFEGACETKCPSVAELQEECKKLKSQVANLQRDIDVLNGNLTSKEETNNVLKQLVESLKNQLTLTK